MTIICSGFNVLRHSLDLDKGVAPMKMKYTYLLSNALSHLLYLNQLFAAGIFPGVHTLATLSDVDFSMNAKCTLNMIAVE